MLPNLRFESKWRMVMSRSIRGALALALAGVLAVLAAPSGALAQAKKPLRVVTTFTVIQDIAQNVAGSAAIVELITRPGAEIHDYQPTPLDVVKAQSADLVLWNGMNLERWFERFFDNVKEVPSVVVTDGIPPMGIAEGPYTGKPNPHAWMSPSNAVIYVANIRQALAKHDPTTRRPTPRTPRSMPPRSRPSTIRCASGCRRSRRASAGSSPARAPSATSPATTACTSSSCGPSTPTSRAHPSRCAA